MSDITIIIPTSPIPSHPSTAILDETIFNLRQYTDCKIVVMFDGVYEKLSHRTEDYDKYKGVVKEKILDYKYGDCVYRDFEWHTHQAKMTAETLRDNVTTELVLFCEHDTSPIGDIPFKKVCDLIKNSKEINCIRFNIFHKVLDEHQHLMIDREPIVVDGIRLVRTIQWSQRPHIAKVKWYRDILHTYFQDKKSMIEDVMHSVVESKYKDLGYDTFGLAIYTPEGETQLRSYHSDGRKTDEKIIIG